MKSAELERMFWQEQVARWQPGHSISQKSLQPIVESVGVVPVKSLEWLVCACRSALFLSNSTARKAGIGQVSIRKKLEALSQETWRLQRKLFNMESEVNNAIFDEAYQRSSTQDLRDLEEFDELPLYGEFKSRIMELDWIAVFLQQVADRAREKRQLPNWRRALNFEERVGSAITLAWVFERGFEIPATINSEPKKPSSSAWPKFFEGVTDLARLSESSGNLREVLLAAKKRTRKNGVSFPPGIMPD